MHTNKKKDGFSKERLLVLPQTIMDKITLHPLIQSLYPTDIGYFPKAQYHYRNRPGGCPQAILILCVQGEGVIEMEGRKYKLSQNQLIIVPADVPHCYYADLVNPWSIHWLHFNGSERDAFTELFKQEEDPVISLTGEMVVRAIAGFDDLYLILGRGYSTQQMVHLSSALRHLLTTLCLEEGQIHGQRLPEHNYIDLCISEMKRNIDKPLSLDQMASRVSLSKNYLVYLFHKKTGYSPVDYFIHLKIQLACQYLDTTGLSIKEIGEAVGYHDAYYFSRIFKKIMRQSPKQYRTLSKG